MKKFTGPLAFAAFAALFFSSCATGKKSDVSFGGGWSDPVNLAKTEKNIDISNENIQSVAVNEISTEVLNNESNSSTIVESNNSISSQSTATSNLSKAEATQKTEKIQTKKANKWLQKAIQKKMAKAGADSNLLYIIIAFFIPFLGVLLFEGEITNHFWISLLLTFLFWLPGFIYAVLVIMGNI